MSTTLIIISIIVLALAVYVVINYKKMKNMPDTPASAKIRILDNKNFKTQIRSGVTLVDFWAPWCGPCKMMSPVLNQVAESLEKGSKVAKVNVDNHQPIAAKYKVRNIPTLILFKDGKEVERYVGIKTHKFLVKEIEKHQQSA
nr:thioredoxin [uncultured Carboxylicivirga sp.]